MMRNPFKVLEQKIDDIFNEKKIEEDVAKGKMEQGSIVWFIRQVGSFIRHVGGIFLDGIGSTVEKNGQKKRGGDKE